MGKACLGKTRHAFFYFSGRWKGIFQDGGEEKDGASTNFFPGFSKKVSGQKPQGFSAKPWCSCPDFFLL